MCDYFTEQLIKANGGPIYVDRDPEIFNYVLKYLRSDRKFIPKNVTQDVSSQIEFEIKYWGLDKGLARIDTLTNVDDIKKIEDILATVPKIDPKNQHISLKNWKKFQPLTINEILEKSDKPIDFDINNIYITEKVFNDARVIG